MRPSENQEQERLEQERKRKEEEAKSRLIAFLTQQDSNQDSSEESETKTIQLDSSTSATNPENERTHFSNYGNIDSKLGNLIAAIGQHILRQKEQTLSKENFKALTVVSPYFTDEQIQKAIEHILEKESPCKSFLKEKGIENYQNFITAIPVSCAPASRPLRKIKGRGIDPDPYESIKNDNVEQFERYQKKYGLRDASEMEAHFSRYINEHKKVPAKLMVNYLEKRQAFREVKNFLYEALENLNPKENDHDKNIIESIVTNGSLIITLYNEKHKDGKVLVLLINDCINNGKFEIAKQLIQSFEHLQDNSNAMDDLNKIAKETLEKINEIKTERTKKEQREGLAMVFDACEQHSGTKNIGGLVSPVKSYMPTVETKETPGFYALLDMLQANDAPEVKIVLNTTDVKENQTSGYELYCVTDTNGNLTEGTKLHYLKDGKKQEISLGAVNELFEELAETTNNNNRGRKFSSLNIDEIQKKIVLHDSNVYRIIYNDASTRLRLELLYRLIENTQNSNPNDEKRLDDFIKYAGLTNSELETAAEKIFAEVKNSNSQYTIITDPEKELHPKLAKKLLEIAIENNNSEIGEKILRKIDSFSPKESKDLLGAAIANNNLKIVKNLLRATHKINPNSVFEIASEIAKKPINDRKAILDELVFGNNGILNLLPKADYQNAEQHIDLYNYILEKSPNLDNEKYRNHFIIILNKITESDSEKVSKTVKKGLIKETQLKNLLEINTEYFLETLFEKEGLDLTTPSSTKLLLKTAIEEENLGAVNRILQENFDLKTDEQILKQVLETGNNEILSVVLVKFDHNFIIQKANEMAKKDSFFGSTELHSLVFSSGGANEKMLASEPLTVTNDNLHLIHYILWSTDRLHLFDKLAGENTTFLENLDKPLLEKIIRHGILEKRAIDTNEGKNLLIKFLNEFTQNFERNQGVYENFFIELVEDDAIRGVLIDRVKDLNGFAKGELLVAAVKTGNLAIHGNEEKKFKIEDLDPIEEGYWKRAILKAVENDQVTLLPTLMEKADKDELISAASELAKSFITRKIHKTSLKQLILEDNNCAKFWLMLNFSPDSSNNNYDLLNYIIKYDKDFIDNANALLGVSEKDTDINKNLIRKIAKRAFEEFNKAAEGDKKNYLNLYLRCYKYSNENKKEIGDLLFTSVPFKTDGFKILQKMLDSDDDSKKQAAIDILEMHSDSNLTKKILFSLFEEKDGKSLFKLLNANNLKDSLKIKLLEVGIKNDESTGILHIINSTKIDSAIFFKAISKQSKELFEHTGSLIQILFNTSFELFKDMAKGEINKENIALAEIAITELEKGDPQQDNQSRKIFNNSISQNDFNELKGKVEAYKRKHSLLPKLSMPDITLFNRSAPNVKPGGLEGENTAPRNRGGCGG